MRDDSRHLMYTTTVVLLVLYLLAAADGAALNGRTGSGSYLNDSYVERKPEEDRDHLELLTPSPDIDDIVKFAEEERTGDLSAWNDTTIYIQDYSDSSDYGPHPYRGIRFCLLLVAFVVACWNAAKKRKAKKASKTTQDASTAEDKVKLVV